MESGRIVLFTFVLCFLCLQVNARHLTLEELLGRNDIKKKCPDDCKMLKCDRENGLIKVPYVDENGCDRCKCIELLKELEKIKQDVRDKPNSKYHDLEEMVLKKSKRNMQEVKPLCLDQCKTVECSPEEGLIKVPYFDENGCNRCKCINLVTELDKIKQDVKDKPNSKYHDLKEMVLKKSKRVLFPTVQPICPSQCQTVHCSAEEGLIKVPYVDEKNCILCKCVKGVSGGFYDDVNDEAHKRASKRSYHKKRAAKLRRLFEALLE